MIRDAQSHRGNFFRRHTVLILYLGLSITKMSSKGIFEADGKKFLGKHLKSESFIPPSFAHVDEDTDLDDLPTTHPWLLEKVYFSSRQEW